MQILQPKRRVDILRDVMEAQSQQRPFVITFCGVNGVGKSTNLAKVGRCGMNVGSPASETPGLWDAVVERRVSRVPDLLLADRERVHGADRCL